MDNNIISLVISIFSLIISTIAAVIIWKFNSISIRNTSRQEHNKLMLEINKLLIENPELWAVYDNHPVNKSIKDTSDHLVHAKRTAFIYHYINFFDILFDFYNRQIFQNKNDKADWKAWDSFITHYFKGSTEAREVYKNSFGLFDDDFSRYIMAKINEIEKDK